MNSEVDNFQRTFDERTDEMLVILRRLDEHREFCIEWKKRIESDVDMLKKHLKLA